jgi:tRNA (guanine37-N1)-methyltransferase
LRDWSTDKYKTVDDHPYGGGPGMVLKFDVLLNAIRDVEKETKNVCTKILLTPQGQVYKQQIAQDLANEKNLILICGHYEGFDERIREYVDTEISVGDYVLTGGELPAMTIIDSVVRLLPGALGDDESPVSESHTDGLLEYPQYTRPETFEGKSVPPVLMNGNHKEIEAWRISQAEIKTKQKRPDLIQS